MVFHSTMSLPPQKIPFAKFLMTSLHVICGLGPPNQKSWLHLWLVWLKRYCSRLVLLRKQELLQVIKKCPKSCFTVLLICENKFNPYDSVGPPIGNPALRNFVRSEIDDLAKYLGEYRTSNSFFRKKFWKVILFWCLESSKCHSVANGTESNGLNLFSKIKGIVEQDFGALLDYLK